MATRYLITGGGSVTWDASNTAIWSASSGGATGASVPVDGDDVIMDAASGGGTVTLGYSPTVTSITMGEFTGTFNASTYSPTMATFSCSGTGTRTLNMGSGTWSLYGGSTGSTTVFNISTTTNLTLDIGTSELNATYTGSLGTRIFRSGDSATYKLPKIKVSAGSAYININGGAASAHYNGLDFTGFSGVLDFGSSYNSQNCYGNIVLSPTMTCANTTGGKTISMLNTGAQSITTNGVVLPVNITINGTGNVTTLQDSLNMTNASYATTLTLTAGTFNANNFNVTCSTFSSSNSNTRTLTMGSGTWTLTGTGTVWNTATTTNLTLNAGTSTIVINNTSASTKTIASGVTTLNNLTFSGISTGAYIIGNATNTSTFGKITLSNYPNTLQIFAGKTIVVNDNPAWSGVLGSLNTIKSTTDTSAWTISAANGIPINMDYISLRDSTATGGATFYAGRHSTNVSGNTGWLFETRPDTMPRLTNQDLLNILAGTVGKSQQYCLNVLAGTTNLSRKDAWNIYAGTTKLRIQDAANVKAGTTNRSIQNCLMKIADLSS